jgi:hypothetical protein
MEDVPKPLLDTWVTLIWPALAQNDVTGWTCWSWRDNWTFKANFATTQSAYLAWRALRSLVLPEGWQITGTCTRRCDHVYLLAREH